MISYASAAPTVTGPTWLGHDIKGWTVALIVAIVAAFIYEATMTLTRTVTRRIPFLVLYLAKITTPKQDWPNLFRAWKGELWHILRSDEKHWTVRFFRGMAFALPLALGAARATAKVATAKRTAVEGRVRRAYTRRHRMWCRRVRWLTGELRFGGIAISELAILGASNAREGASPLWETVTILVAGAMVVSLVVELHNSWVARKRRRGR
ncbi:hypothetical protein [Streptomyces eurythermus]